jgi:hypothetical protein
VRGILKECYRAQVIAMGCRPQLGASAHSALTSLPSPHALLAWPTAAGKKAKGGADPRQRTLMAFMADTTGDAAAAVAAAAGEAGGLSQAGAPAASLAEAPAPMAAEPKGRLKSGARSGSAAGARVKAKARPPQPPRADEEEAAGHERRRIPSRLLPWPCAACTFENPGAALKCSMCGTKKGLAAPAPEVAAEQQAAAAQAAAAVQEAHAGSSGGGGASGSGGEGAGVTEPRAKRGGGSQSGKARKGRGSVGTAAKSQPATPASGAAATVSGAVARCAAQRTPFGQGGGGARAGSGGSTAARQRRASPAAAPMPLVSQKRATPDSSDRAPAGTASGGGTGSGVKRAKHAAGGGGAPAWRGPRQDWVLTGSGLCEEQKAELRRLAQTSGEGRAWAALATRVGSLATWRAAGC